MTRKPLQIDRDKMLAIARRTATADQRKALAEFKGA
jgi:hypothetical protein